MNVASDQPEGKFRQALQELGWADGRNVRVETRGAAALVDSYRKHAASLVALAPDVVLAVTTTAAAELQQASRTVPIVFTQIIDPVGSGLVASEGTRI